MSDTPKTYLCSFAGEVTMAECWACWTNQIGAGDTLANNWLRLYPTRLLCKREHFKKDGAI